jgi:hypothetical protein
MDMMLIPNRGRDLALIVAALAFAVGLLTLALLAKPTHAQAHTESFNEWVPVSTVIQGECLSEDISLEGSNHVVGTTTQDAGGNSHVQGHTNLVVEGVGITSGDVYVVREVNNMNGNLHDFEGDQAPATFTQPYTLHAIRKGPDTPEDDFVVRFLSRTTVNANGEVTSSVEEARVECY